MSDDQTHDPLNFMRNLWGNMGFSLPGMVTPTFDVEELDKRIKDMKAVEGWLRMNLSMLQMTIQSLEMQRTTVSTVQAMGRMASDAARSATEERNTDETTVDAQKSAFSEAAMWPWQMMQQMREQMQQHAETAAQTAQAETTPETESPTGKSPRRGRKTD
ncbi:MAG: hypothetical protein L6Q55_01960 [Azonexus sp.]|nr:PhaM family polyhydroxyalkanoate granule multifunctional regulatory protein [Azonexus sp.]MCK6411173.1 hypothetical protein [Azonexus sp.]